MKEKKYRVGVYNNEEGLEDDLDAFASLRGDFERLHSSTGSPLDKLRKS